MDKSQKYLVYFDENNYNWCCDSQDLQNHWEFPADKGDLLGLIGLASEMAEVNGYNVVDRVRGDD